MHGSAWSGLAMAAAVAVAACGGDAGPNTDAAGDSAVANGAPATIREIALGDSVRWQTELAEGWLHQVVVRTDRGADTIPDVLVEDEPVVVGDTAVIGFARDGATIASGFLYRAGTGRLERFDLPDDLNPAFAAPAVSPDGRHIAYVANRSLGWSWGMVRSWPDGAIVAAGDTLAVPGSDVTASRARWLDDDSYEAFIEQSGPHHVFRGNLAEGFIRRDLVEEAPEWVVGRGTL